MAGNKSKLTHEFIKDATKLAEGGLRNVDICKALGIHESTLYAWLKDEKNPMARELSEELEKARAKRKAFMIQTITKAAREGTWQAAAWYLERVYPQEFGRCQRLPKRDEKTLDAVRELMKSITVASEKADDGA